ncbi:MAG: cellulase family glycosylhydrolase [Haloarculaceae archaeon]
MHRRNFLRWVATAAAAGAAGCETTSDGDATTSRPGVETSAGAPTETATRTPRPTTGSGRTPTETATQTETPTETATPTETPTETPTPTPAIESSLPRLTTDGKWVVDEDGNEVVLRGLATVEPWWGDQYASQRGTDYMGSLERLTDESDGWYPSVVRIPCTVNWQETGIDRYVLRYLDEIVRHCAEQDVYVILDHHLIRPYDTDETDRLMREFWNAVAPRYADHPHVVYELFNEPTKPHHWEDDPAAWSAWKRHAQPWVDLVREHAPETPLIVGSPRWTSVTNMAAEEPFDGDHLIYSGHIYPGNGQPDEFDSTYGAPAEEVPVMITEFGWDRTGDPAVDEGTTSGWGEPFREWIESYPNVGWQGWCFDPIWEPALVDTEWNLLGGDPYAGHFLKRWLYERRGDRNPEPVPTEGAPYSEPSDSTPPPVPSGITVRERSSEEFRVLWSPVEDGETSAMFYVVYVNGSVEDAVEDRFSLTVSGTAGETYDVAVSAVDAVGNESDRSDTATVTLGE